MDRVAEESASQSPQLVAPDDIFVGGGEMGAFMRTLDWSRTPLGPIASWPQSLRTAVSICLASRFPILIWWGADLVMLYNDAYRDIIADKHPRAMGRPGRECWPEIWHIIGPMLEGVLREGRATWSDDQLLLLERHGYPEECYFTFSYSPIRDETGGVGGVFCAVTETTAKVLGERRLRTLRELTAGASDARTAEEACERAVAALAHNPADAPFALLYLLESEDQARLVGTAGIEPGLAASPASVDLSAAAPTGAAWPLAHVAATQKPEVIRDLSHRFGALGEKPVAQAADCALVLPVAQPGQEQMAGFLIAGVSPHRALDDEYRGFFSVVAGQIAAGIANARAYEALAELDRAKTAFFSNVSHEFRTPLTLLLNPIEDGLADAGDPLSPGQRARQEIAHRNALRLLKLVNTLLDFSRIEAGRIHAAYEPTDLAASTIELASVFRSAVERAGLRFTVDCPPLSDPVYVDREMWEKIVLNLLSNALKFTFAGEIAVTLRQSGDAVELSVRDTGVGIPAAELAHLFERFHRVQNTQARTQEGTGIGLALVRELVDLHGGDVRVASIPGAGSTFTIAIPTGVAHLPAEHVIAEPREPAAPHVAAPHVAAPHVAAPFVEEALRWLPNDGDTSALDVPPSTTLAPDSGMAVPTIAERGHDAPTARILLADDNADMRAYLTHLLGPYWTVEAVPDGATALAVARDWPPDLVVSDVMMPGMDGFELLRALRGDERTRTVPVMLLSARAGEEAAVEGLEAGADDYLVKPFTARELLARVTARLELTRLRHEASEHEGRLGAIIESMADGVFIYDAEGRISQMNTAARQMFALDAQPEYASLPLEVRMRQVQPRDEHGRPLSPDELPQRRTLRGEVLEGPAAVDIIMRALDGRDVQFNQSGAPVRDAAGNIIGAVAVCRDVTERRRLERQLRWQASMLERAHDAIVIWELGGPIVYWNRGAELLYGFTKDAAIGSVSHDLLHTHLPTSQGDFEQMLERDGEWTGELTHTTVDGQHIVVSSRMQLLRDADGRRYVLESNRDITEQRRLERQTHETLDALLGIARELVEAPDESGAGDPFALGRGLAELIYRIFPLRYASIFTLTPDTESLELLAAIGYTPEQEAQLRQRNTGLSLSIRFHDPEQRARLLAGESVVVDVTQPLYREQRRLYGITQAVIVPMRIGDRTIGTLGMNPLPNVSLTPHELALAEGVAQMAALVIERDRLLREREEARASALALRETNRRMEEFLGIAGHELKTPVTVIKANVQLLSRAGSHSTREDALLHRSERQVDRLARLIEDLLDISRIRADKLELDRQPVDLAAIIRDIVEGQRLAHPDRAITLKLPRRDVVPVLADADRIGQVLSNYLTNALKYSPEDRPVAVSIQLRDHTAHVSVRDEGPGIPAVEQPHIWEPFHRVAGIEVQSGSGVGLGLGLHISKTIVERHGGEVGVESAPGVGSTFWFTVPVAAS